MQSLPVLLRQSLRSGIHITRTTGVPTRLQCRPTSPNSFPFRPTSRTFVVCAQRQFRQLPGSYSANDDKNKGNEEVERVARLVKEAEAPESIPMPGPDAGSARNANTASTEPPSQSEKQEPEKSTEPQGPGPREEQGDIAEGAEKGGLPSYLENRRSKWSKQFSTVMDNVQSNVFVAGQRLNDLTGYSGIEALKNEIHAQGMRHRYGHSEEAMLISDPSP